MQIACGLDKLQILHSVPEVPMLNRLDAEKSSKGMAHAVEDLLEYRRVAMSNSSSTIAALDVLHLILDLSHGDPSPTG
ncbi:uncharacterized protein BO95DRAFT_465678 [Aspergillus brunneoviolaceus CBS 621.78]|uniref:Uncharacterized protein n=1 Tax=Aspergillus brunneoviolaceus CBS 621.78 TaxID=1450534 RepID=A0ACD1G3C3_9EURO|nr:hypothetical protein BO95DRAFT_465678 [Aspergillus brunneoviolaceus CBS 621.78]RAH43766.1 hypothetical protein BO95DRAFT_465678 [Aspergillus brunneoviolaceus CBS 621.78]